MVSFLLQFIDKVIRKLGIIRMIPLHRRYLAGIGPNHPLFGIKSRIVGDASGDPTEYFDHYDSFAYWSAKRISGLGGRRKILDVGSPKIVNGIFSVSHDVHALVLADCSDRLSEVNYHIHDVSNPLPFASDFFDAFTSTVSLPLVGLGRYGDALDPNCLVNLIAELGRVMKLDSDLFISMCLGPNVLNFNNGWFLDFPTIQRLFQGWELVEYLVDQESSPHNEGPSAAQRFTENTSVDGMKVGDNRVIFIHFLRRKQVINPSL